MGSKSAPCSKTGEQSKSPSHRRSPTCALEYIFIVYTYRGVTPLRHSPAMKLVSVRVHPMQGEKGLAATGFLPNYFALGPQRRPREASRTCHASGKAGSAPGIRRSARAADGTVTTRTRRAVRCYHDHDTGMVRHIYAGYGLWTRAVGCVAGDEAVSLFSSSGTSKL